MTHVYHEFPKWVEKDGHKFIVHSAAEEAEHFPPKGKKAAPDVVDVPTPSDADPGDAAPPAAEPKKRKKSAK